MHARVNYDGNKESISTHTKVKEFRPTRREEGRLVRPICSRYLKLDGYLIIGAKQIENKSDKI